MNQSVESRIVQEFRERLARGDLEGVNLINRVSGGMPGEDRIEQETYISGRHLARVRARSIGAPAEEATSDLNPDQVQALFDKVGRGIDSLVPRSKARFVPDSVVGSITIEVDGEQATFFYLVDEEDRAAQDAPVESEMSDAIVEIETLSKKLRNIEED